VSRALLVSFWTNFLAELPDKTMFATIVLASRHRRPMAVLVGVNVAFIAHAVLAVAVGEALRALPVEPVRWAVAAVFFIGGVVMLRGESEDDDVVSTRQANGALAVAVAAGLVILLAEFGDFTQLATVGVAASYGFPVAVAVGSIAAHVVVAGLAVAAGERLQRRLPVQVIQRAAGALFIVLSVATAATVIW
jgi:Ca2+/H+ antiporter, TMEM165/GDT1 family